MTQLPPTLSHELEDYETWIPTATMTTDDLEPDETYQCDECDEAFDTPQGLAAHARSHE